MDLLDRIDLLCKEQGTSRRKISMELGFSPSTMTKWASHKPSADKLALVAERLGVSTNYLLTGEADDDVYYIDKDIAMKAQEAYLKNRLLFKALEGSRPEDVQMAVDLLNRLKETNRDG